MYFFVVLLISFYLGRLHHVECKHAIKCCVNLCSGAVSGLFGVRRGQCMQTYKMLLWQRTVCCDYSCESCVVFKGLRLKGHIDYAIYAH